MRLNVDEGIFFEFIPASEYFDENPSRLTLAEVEVGVQYALIVTSNAGLWAYDVGDTVKFTSIDPYRLVVTGRIKHFTSAFGEHVIAEEVEGALQDALEAHGGAVAEFHVAPEVNPVEGLPYHEWLVEFTEMPQDLKAFAASVNTGVVERNPYYKDLITGGILRPAELTQVKRGTFNGAMASLGKLGGQNKPPRLANGRDFAAALEKSKQRVKILALIGGSGSGKSTILNGLRKHFGERAAVLSLDNYYRPKSELPVDENGETNFDLPEVINDADLVRDIDALRAGRPIALDTYTYNRDVMQSEKITIAPAEWLVVEGLVCHGLPCDGRAD